MSPDIQDLVDGYFDESLSDKQLQQLSHWIKSDPRHARQFASALMLHDRLRNQFIANDNHTGQELGEPCLVSQAKAIDRRSQMKPTIVWAATACLVLLSTLLFWQSLGTSTASAAILELNRIMAANDRSLDRTFAISVQTTSIPQRGPGRNSPESGRPPKPSLDQAILDVRGSDQFVLQRKTWQGELFVTGSNGVTSWAVRPDGPVRFSNDLTRFNRDVPGHEYSLPINNLHDGLGVLRTTYDLNLLPAEVSESGDGSNDGQTRRMIAVKKHGYLGPAEVEITYTASSGQIRQLRFVEMPYGPEDVTLTMTLINEHALAADYFGHQSHHDPHRIVELE
ncbi:hypothetical protein [Rubripirellula reticaptiva]|uniref:Uncharacterized protein n=1 Tax=Rubripirellula reticaptiva TaxID=2528013 RepID=A0A5C6EJT3_9BACT|nr:hypothetical protein [Rubripirellula reticaptiva]TWU49078.1 hypothetical protein Poly59_36910 [Rubripirellula reticaptiva]